MYTSKMKLPIILSLMTLLSGLAAGFQFAPAYSRVSRQSSFTCTSLAAKSRRGGQSSSPSWWVPAATAAIGWAMAGQIAVATPDAIILHPSTEQQNTLVIADAMSLDFSMPTYDASSKSSQGFGDGTEAILNRERGDVLFEKEKQAESMRKAEEARKTRIAAEKAKKKEMEKEAKDREAARKIEKAERLKNIWN
jgi:hypothetical protein